MDASTNPLAKRLREHAISKRLADRVDDGAWLLAMVMGLSLVDGIFVALILAGTLDTAFGVIETGLLVFGGSAALAVILAELKGSRRGNIVTVLLIGAFLVPFAALQAVFAPALASVLNMAVFERFAGVVILAIAAHIASARVGDCIPSPSAIIVLGLVASVQPSGLTLELGIDPGLVARAATAAGVGVAFALGVVILEPYLRENVNVERFRFGSAIALALLALPILGLLETEAPISLAALLIAAVLAYEPGGTLSENEGGNGAGEDSDGGEEAPVEREPWM